MSSCRPRFLYLALCFLTFSIFSVAQKVSVRPLVTRPVDESDLTTLKGNSHPLAQPQFDVGAASPDMPLERMLLVLKHSPEQDRALRTMLDNQQDRRSPEYHKWLTPDEFGAQFGVADEDLETITGWLQSHGFEINRISHGRNVIEFSGTEGQVEGAFRTSIHKYLVNGEEHWANATDPQIPSALAAAVAGVWSLHDFRKKPDIRIWPEKLTTKYTPGKRPATTLSNSNATIYALSPADFATIYNINPIYDRGSTGAGGIAVVARSDLYAGGSDVTNFWQVFGVAGGSLRVIHDGPDPGDLGGGEEGEATLDASWSGAIAPGATVDFVVSASTNATDGVDLSELYIIDNNLASVMTESFGSCDTLATSVEAQADSQLAEQAAAQGITYLVSSGDSGAAGCADPTRAPTAAGAAVNILGTPYNVVVGGTQFNENGNDGKYWSSTNQSNEGSALSYIPEDVWNESCESCQSPNLYASGGGASKYYAKPPWQSGVAGIPGDEVRDQPDVALTAAGGHDPYLVCLEASCIPDASGNFSVYLVGGTSASAPSFAAIMNLVDQQNGPQGQANYVLYGLAAAENNSSSQCNASNPAAPPAATCIFNDVTSGNNSVPGQSGFSAGTGYDLATGLGSVNVDNLVNNWSSITFRATTTTLGPGSITGMHGLPVTLNVSVAPNTPPGTPTGDVSLRTSSGQAVGFLTLNNGSQSAAVDTLPGGSYRLTARYGGDASFKPSPPSNTVSVNLSPETSRITMSLLTLDQNGHLIPFTGGPYGSFVYVRADVAGQSGVGFPTGSVSFVDNANGATTALGSLNLNAQGNTATPEGYFNFSAGSHSLSANYAGDPSFQASSSSTAAFNITPASTTTTLSPVSGVVLGNSVTLTANISSPAFAGWAGACIPFPCAASPYPSGKVTFFAGAKQVGSVQVTSSQVTSAGITAVGSFTTSTLPGGQDTITAQYGGDTNYLASTAPAITVGVDADFAIAAANASINVASPGGNATNSLTITGQTGYNSTINFSTASCDGLPALSSCSFSPASLTGNGSTNLRIQTTASTSAALRPPKWTGMGLVFAGVLLWSVPRRRSQVVLGMGFLLCLALGSVGCGGASSKSVSTSSPGTPAGSYNVTITATTSDDVISHTTNFTLVVQQ